jgi:hypothetical protein
MLSVETLLQLWEPSLRVSTDGEPWRSDLWETLGTRGSNPRSSTERETSRTHATAGVLAFVGSDGSQVGPPISVAFLVET